MKDGSILISRFRSDVSTVNVSGSGNKPGDVVTSVPGSTLSGTGVVTGGGVVPLLGTLCPPDEESVIVN
jgi:hypothetical protein